MLEKFLVKFVTACANVLTCMILLTSFSLSIVMFNLIMRFVVRNGIPISVPVAFIP